YLLVLDTVNFSFWAATPGGSWQLAERLRDAFEAGDELAEPAGLAAVTAAGPGQVLGDLPMRGGRAAALGERGGTGLVGLGRPGEPAEVEIRAATVVTVERLREALAARGRRLMDIEVDWILWDLSQGLYPVRPYHRTRTIFY